MATNSFCALFGNTPDYGAGVAFSKIRLRHFCKLIRGHLDMIWYKAGILWIFRPPPVLSIPATYFWPPDLFPSPPAKYTKETLPDIYHSVVFPLQKRENNKKEASNRVSPVLYKEKKEALCSQNYASLPHPAQTRWKKQIHWTDNQAVTPTAKP